MKLTLFTKDFEDNSTGRAYALWLLAQHLGWQCQIVAPQGDHVWGPVAVPDFEAACSVRASRSQQREAAAASDLVISVKPVPGSFDLALAATRDTGRPLLVDIDDPDIEGLLSLGNLPKALAKSLLRPRSYWKTRRLRRALPSFPHTVSNPVLERAHGGELIPHARVDSGVGNPHISWQPQVVFVGTNRPHKGIVELRRAVSQLAADGFTLTITDERPPDALAHENWVGFTSLTRGIELVKHADIVVIPSRANDLYAAGQLPVKIVDAMLAGRALVVSDLEPLRWAIGPAGGTLVGAGEHEQLLSALRAYRDPSLRSAHGANARHRAISQFTVDALAPRFAAACLRTVRRD
ncbi:MAG: glycosyltransferase [Microbacterium sp.]|jgi:glycosyltransferase involved in cell wall biosynthesis|uniref:glycosyltransferase family 4 protein n=1 Tax=Microbacterium sp. TaxID=51671 RepID=UPI0026100490|nr:glycosyltransferase family 4 protein [Microbacterium sp.]MDF2561446.1 glycosyltransferase [Microbacterium sp.]